MGKRQVKRKKPDRHHFGIALPDNLYVAHFTYPMSTTKLDKHWEASPGLRVAPCCKMLFGAEPFRWHDADAPIYCVQMMAMENWTADAKGVCHVEHVDAEPIVSAAVIELPYEEDWRAPPIVIGEAVAEED